LDNFVFYFQGLNKGNCQRICQQTGRERAKGGDAAMTASNLKVFTFIYLLRLRAAHAGAALF
jgi:hypothetical protein